MSKPVSRSDVFRETTVFGRERPLTVKEVRAGELDLHPQHKAAAARGNNVLGLGQEPVVEARVAVRVSLVSLGW